MACLLCVLVTVALGSFLIQPATKPPHKPSTPDVGIFYYTWYDPDLAVSWDKTKVVDTPTLGYYNSCDPEVIRQHLLWLEDLGVDFVVLSWWGTIDEYGAFTDRAAQQVFSIAQATNSSLRFTVMVEPFSKLQSPYNYTEIYDRIYRIFASQYPSLYYNLSKPLVCFFNDDTLTAGGTVPQDPRFDTRIVGQRAYSQWVYTDLNPYDSNRAAGQNQISVTGRYDESHLNRAGNVTVDVCLNEGIYDREWQNVLQRCGQGTLETVLICSWNEFPERTAIEPHVDATAADQSSYFLYDKTRVYIEQLRQSTP